MTEDDNYAQVVESNSGCNVIFAIGKIASPHATGMLMIYPSFLMSSHREVTYTAGFKRDAVTMYAVINKLAWNYDGTHVSGGVPTISSPVITSPWTLGGQSSTF